VDNHLDKGELKRALTARIAGKEFNRKSTVPKLRHMQHERSDASRQCANAAAVTLRRPIWRSLVVFGTNLLSGLCLQYLV
jgi:hypothetical protein